MKHGAALLLFVSFAGTSQALAQRADEKLTSELVRLYTDWSAAHDTGQEAAMNPMEVPNLVLVMPGGNLWKKDAPRKSSGTPTGFTKQTLNNANVRQFGDTAILTGDLSTEPLAGEAGTTVVFVRQAGGWQIASAHWTLKNQPEPSINNAGYALMNSNKVTEAIELFKMNARLYPQSWNVYDSLGEAYAKAGNTALAIENYEKSIQMNPKNETGTAELKKLKGK